MKHPGRYLFVTTCIDADGDDINEMKYTATPVSLATFRTAIGLEQWHELQRSLGYDRFMPISRDWIVGYYKSTYRGVPAYYLVWSAIEHVFTLHGQQ
jgi:hypothetical protein